jgi:hypothetical protein
MVSAHLNYIICLRVADGNMSYVFLVLHSTLFCICLFVLFFSDEKRPVQTGKIFILNRSFYRKFYSFITSPFHATNKIYCLET